MSYSPYLEEVVMKKYGMSLFILLALSLVIAACSVASTPAPEPTATEVPPTVVPTATEIPFGCNGDEYWWSDEVVNVPYGQEVIHTYERSGLTWNATLSCTGWRFSVVSDLPEYPEGPITTVSCDGSEFTVIGIEIEEYECGYSLLFGDEDENPPQISIRFDNDGREMIYDLEFWITTAEPTEERPNPSPYIDYLIWGGFTDTGDWADIRCQLQLGDGYDVMGFAGANSLDPNTTEVNALCGGEGFVFEMETTNK